MTSSLKSPLGALSSLYKPQRLGKVHLATQGHSLKKEGLALIISKRGPESTPRNTSLVPSDTAPLAPGQAPPAFILTSRPVAFAPKGIAGPKPTHRFGKAKVKTAHIDGIRCYVPPSAQRSDQNTAQMARSIFWSDILTKALAGICLVAYTVRERKRKADITYIRRACQRQPSGHCIYSHASVQHLICWWW